ncbi:Fimbrial adapter PapK (plasmid) [Pantoea sp. Nvir]|uniref:fimbrial protein n=1 Tax=Pantoea sp. Nvir TaxID=2576760 RepID=UPI0030D18A18
MKFKMISTIITLLTSLICMPSQGSSPLAESEIEFGGTLVAEPCIVTSGSDGDNVVVDFGTIADRTFYSGSGRRTWLQPFHILLTECNTMLSKEVKIMFRGAEDAEQPGLLASGIKHIAIGLQTESGTALPFNKQTQPYTLQNGNTQLNFKAYVQASEEGVRNQSIELGAFDAVSTFELEYP